MTGVRVQHFHTAAPKVRPHARACAHTRPRHRRGVGERPHMRGSVERTASLAVAKTRCRGGQTRWPWRAEWPLQGIPSEKAASGGCGPISTNHVALFGLGCTRFYPAPCFGHIPTRYTLFWPPPKKNKKETNRRLQHLPHNALRAANRVRTDFS